MRKLVALVLASLAIIQTACTGDDTGRHDEPVVAGKPLSVPTVDSDGTVTFDFEGLNETVVAFADREYGASKPDYSDPENDVGTPPFKFEKRLDCEVIRVAAAIEKLIKKTGETASFHSVVLLRDARQELYAFTLTSFVPDKSKLQLRSYGPVTNEDPDIVHLPIQQRRLKEFPIDFATGAPLSADRGKCIFVPYPFPADQEYWLFGDKVEAGELQRLYRNDRYKNLDQLIKVIIQAVKSSDNQTSVRMRNQ